MRAIDVQETIDEYPYEKRRELDELVAQIQTAVREKRGRDTGMGYLTAAELVLALGELFAEHERKGTLWSL